MSSEFIIKDGFVTKLEVRSRETMPLKHFMSQLTSYEPLALSPLPDNTKYIAVSPDSDENKITIFIVTETPPQRRPILYNNQNYNLVFPYERFWFAIEGTRNAGIGNTGRVLYNARNWGYLWGNTPFVNLDTPSTNGRMPNVYGNSNVCFGVNNVNSQQAFGNYIGEVMNKFYTSPFNDDLSYPFAYSTLTEWEEKSEDPTVWREWTWIWQELKSTAEMVQEGRETFPTTLPDGPGDVIPEIRPIPTFANLQTWWNSLETDAQQRFAAFVESVDV